MHKPERIYLSGFMGAGKTTIGRPLAEHMDTPFWDLDTLIVEEAGKPISHIFEDSGEGGFRQLERKTLLEQASERRGVIALGGGSLQNQQVLDYLKDDGILVFIKVPITLIIERISGDISRPMLLDEQGNPKEHEQLYNDMQVLYEERLPLYSQAHITLKVTDENSPQELAEKLIPQIQSYGV